jgi:MtN3 and saliva related transmembrane protein
MDGTQILGLAAGILTSSSLLPQLIKTIKEKKAEDISLFFLLTLMAGIGLWIVYGYKRDDYPIMITNAFSLLVNLALLVMSIKYKKESS